MPHRVKIDISSVNIAHIYTCNRRSNISRRNYQAAKILKRKLLAVLENASMAANPSNPIAKQYFGAFVNEIGHIENKR